MKRIKQLAQKESSNQFSSFYPIGADGINIDMLSGTNLEEEMHLGSPSITTIDNIDGIVVITEQYKKDEKQNNNFHEMITTLQITDNEMNIEQKLNFYDINGSKKLKKTKITTFENINNKLKIKEVVS